MQVQLQQSPALHRSRLRDGTTVPEAVCWHVYALIYGRRWRLVLLTFGPTRILAGTAMHCFVYASQRKADTYLWLMRRDNFDVLPAPLALMLGDLRFVLEVELHAERRLPNEDNQVVMDHLLTQGWHLQLPPQQTLESASGASQDTTPRRQDG